MSNTENERLAALIAQAEEDNLRSDEADDSRQDFRVAPPRLPAQVYSVRLPVDRIEELRRVAEDAGQPPSVLMRTWVLERLNEEIVEGRHCSQTPDLAVHAVVYLAEVRDRRPQVDDRNRGRRAAHV